MKNMIRWVGASAVLAFAAAAQAQVYVEGAYSAMNYKEPSVSVKPAAFSGVVGY